METVGPGESAGSGTGQHGHFFLIIICFQSVRLLAGGQKEYAREDNLYKHQTPKL